MLRRILSRAIPATVLGLMGAGQLPAIARADAVKPPPAQLRPAMFKWQGPYAGAIVTLHHLKLNVDDFQPSASDLSGDGSLAGVLAGYNWSNRHWVWGAEADITFAETGVLDRGTSSAALIATGRLRAGRKFDGLFAYVTGGLVYAEFDARLASLDTVVSFDRLGAVAGAGVEFALTPGATARIDYLHARLLDTGSRSRIDMLRAALVLHLNGR